MKIRQQNLPSRSSLNKMATWHCCVWESNHNQQQEISFSRQATWILPQCPRRASSSPCEAGPETLEQCVKLRSCRRKLLHMGSPLLDKLFRLCTRASPGTMSSLCPWSFTTPRNTSLVLRTVRQPRPSQILSLGMGMSKPCSVAACWGANRSWVLLPGGEAATQRQAGAGKGDEARDKPPVRLRSVARC